MRNEMSLKLPTRIEPDYPLCFTILENNVSSITRSGALVGFFPHDLIDYTACVTGMNPVSTHQMVLNRTRLPLGNCAIYPEVIDVHEVTYEVPVIAIWVEAADRYLPRKIYHLKKIKRYKSVELMHVDLVELAVSTLGTDRLCQFVLTRSDGRMLLMKHRLQT